MDSGETLQSAVPQVRLWWHPGAVRIEGGSMLVGDAVIATATPDVLARFTAALEDGATEDDLIDAFLDDPPAVAASVLHLLDVAERAGGIAYGVDLEHGALRIEPERAPLEALSGRSDAPGIVHVLPTSWLEPVPGGWALHDPRSAYSARITGGAATLLGTLEGATPSSMSRGDRAALTLLFRARLVGGDPVAPSYWDAHDLRFHWRSRKGRHRRVIGATFPRRGTLPVREVVDVPDSTAQVIGPFTGPFIRPGPDAAAESAYAALLDRRRSTRRAAQPLTEEGLGAFLNAHGITTTIPMDEAAGVEYPQSRRLYPGGGATYEIDLNVTVREPIGAVSPGVWWWNPEDLRLHLRSADRDLVERLFDDARVSTGGEGEPAALITYTVRIGRNSWKYDGMAYRLALMDVGVLYHHAYLVAADLGLGICGLGNGDGLLFDRGLGLDIEREASIAELILTGTVADG